MDSRTKIFERVDSISQFNFYLLRFDIVIDGDHRVVKISKPILPLEFIFGWYIRVVNKT